MTLPTRLIGQVGLLLATAACTPALLPSGRYVETAAPGTLLLAGQAVTILDAHRFAYVRWSDDLASSHYGAGSYQLRGRTVHLTFEAQPPRVAQAQVLARQLPTPADSVLLTFLVESIGTIQAAPEPIPFATVRAYDATGHDLRAVLTDLRGRATLRLARSAVPPLLSVTSLGFATWRAAGPASSTAYHLQLPATAGTPCAAGTTKFFRVQRPAGQWALREDPRQLPLLLQAPTK